MTRSIPFLLAVLLFAGCNFFHRSPDKSKQVIARVYDKYLYQSDLAGVGSGAATPDDSIQAVRNYIDSWIRHNLLLRYSQDNLPEEEQRLNDRLQDYKESLLIYLYENELVNQKLDTTVSEAEIEKYYNDHKDVFSLREDIVQFKYVMLPVSEPVKLDSVKSWLRNANDFNRPKLRGFCKDHAARYAIDDSMWYNKDNVASLLPVDRFNLLSALNARSYLEVADSGFGYLIKFNDYRSKGADAPVDYVRNEIAGIVVNQRKIDFLSKIHKSIYDDALKNGEFEIYMDQGIKTNNE